MRKINLILAVLLLIFVSVCQAWQQRVAYNIEARLDTVGHKLYASQHLRYFNNSPDTLNAVWFNLYPNAYRDDNTFFAREAEQQEDYRFRRSRPEDRGYIEISSVLVSDILTEFKYGEDPTLASLKLPVSLAPGDSVDFSFDFTVKVPKFFSRMGHSGNHYEISQWYPKIAVYDAKGWHADGYHYIGEFYGDYGSFQVGLTVPKDFKIGSTGSEVYGMRRQWSAGKDSIGYHLFTAENVHDFAWCADSEYIPTTEQHGETTIIILTRPKDREKWKNVMQYAKDALDYYGRWYGEYPYFTLTICDGDMSAGGGMEYPNMVIVSTGEDQYTRTLEMVVMHEIGHQWFYGMLGNNEMDEPWLDEGINSFSEQRYFEEKYGPSGNYLAKESLRKLLPEASNRNVGRVIPYLYSANKMDQPVLIRADKSRRYRAVCRQCLHETGGHDVVAEGVCGEFGL